MLVPLISMQFTKEVDWNLFDFTIGGVLIFITGMLIEIAAKKIKNSNYRITLLILLVIVFLLIWAELAVGILGTPFGGN